MKRRDVAQDEETRKSTLHYTTPKNIYYQFTAYDGKPELLEHM